MVIIFTGMYALPVLVPFLENKYYVVFVLALSGVATSGNYAPTYLILQEIAKKEGYPHSIEKLQLIVGFWITFSMSGKLNVCTQIIITVCFGQALERKLIETQSKQI